MPEAVEVVSGLVVSRLIVSSRNKFDGPNSGGFCRLLAASIGVFPCYAERTTERLGASLATPKFQQTKEFLMSIAAIESVLQQMRVTSLQAGFTPAAAAPTETGGFAAELK